MPGAFPIGRGPGGADIPVRVNNQGALLVDLQGASIPIGGLAIPSSDYAGLTYTGANLTQVVYRQGGASGTIVATVTLTYDGSSNITSVTVV